MSWAVTTYTCQQCHLELCDLHTWGSREYVLSNDVRLPMNWTLGWCSDCNNICAVELLDPLARQGDLDQATNDLHALGPRPGPQADEQSIANWNYLAGLVEDAQDAQRIAIARSGQLCCLRCGGGQVRPWQALEREPLRPFHPACGGQMHASQDGFRIALKPTISRYTPDGRFIETVDVPGYSMPEHEYFDDRSTHNARIRGLWSAAKPYIDVLNTGRSDLL
jgi:hypothetical protein